MFCNLNRKQTKSYVYLDAMLSSHSIQSVDWTHFRNVKCWTKSLNPATVAFALLWLYLAKGQTWIELSKYKMELVQNTRWMFQEAIVTFVSSRSARDRKSPNITSQLWWEGGYCRSIPNSSYVDHVQACQVWIVVPPDPYYLQSVWQSRELRRSTLCLLLLRVFRCSWDPLHLWGSY